MTRRIPLFPLPGVVLLPGTMLPLHIFEPRYRAMVADALAGNRMIGMAKLKPGWEEVEECPAVHEVGGAGEIVESERLEDGRYNILLEARFRYRILGEEPEGTLYRTASVEEIASIPFGSQDEETRVSRMALSLFERIGQQLELPPIPDGLISPERLASEMALQAALCPRGASGASGNRFALRALRDARRPHARVAEEDPISRRPSARKTSTSPRISLRSNVQGLRSRGGTPVTLTLDLRL